MSLALRCVLPHVCGGQVSGAPQARGLAATSWTPRPRLAMSVRCCLAQVSPRLSYMALGCRMCGVQGQGGIGRGKDTSGPCTSPGDRAPDVPENLCALQPHLQLEGKPRGGQEVEGSPQDRAGTEGRTSLSFGSKVSGPQVTAEPPQLLPRQGWWWGGSRVLDPVRRMVLTLSSSTPEDCGHRETATLSLRRQRVTGTQKLAETPNGHFHELTKAEQGQTPHLHGFASRNHTRFSW